MTPMTPFIDLHCDTLMKAWLRRKKDIVSFPKTRVDVERLQTGGCMAQFFAIFLPPLGLKKYMGPFFPKDEAYITALHRIFTTTVERSGGRLAFAKSAADVEAGRAAGVVSGLLTLEDGRTVDGRMENLERFYQMGIRLISLTWNNPNCFGFPSAYDPGEMARGLTDFGKDAVRRMNELGMLVDVSHLSDGGFWDVASVSRAPFVASHSNSRALSPHKRNLTDDMIRAIGNAGGVAGLNFGPEFLSATPKDKESRRQGTLAQLAQQARHMANVGGMGCVAIGTDFDGNPGTFPVEGPDKMQQLFEYLQKEGFTQDEVEQIACGNALRVMKDVLK